MSVVIQRAQTTIERTMDLCKLTAGVISGSELLVWLCKLTVAIIIQQLVELISGQYHI